MDYENFSRRGTTRYRITMFKFMKLAKQLGSLKWYSHLAPEGSVPIRLQKK